MEVALQHRHHKGVTGVGSKVVRQAGQRQPPEGAHGKDLAHGLVHRRGTGLNDLCGAPCRLLDHEDEHCEQQPRHCGDIERRTPAVESLNHGTDREEGQQQAKRQTEHEDAHCPCALVRREQVADQRIGRRCIAGLTHANTHANDQEAPEVPGRTGQRGKATPDRQAPTHDLAARANVSHAPQLNTSQRINNREGSAAQAQLEITQIPLHAQRLDDDGRDGAVEKVEHVRQEQQKKDPPGVLCLLWLLHELTSLVIQPCRKQDKHLWNGRFKESHR